MALLGLVCGLVAALPMALLLRRGAKSLGRGMASVGFAFAFVQAALVAVHLLWPADLVPFGTLAVLALLATVVVGALARS